MRLGARVVILGMMTGLPASSWAMDLGTYKGCNATDAQFATTQLYKGAFTGISGDNSKASVLKLSFDANAGNFSDVYFILKTGVIKRYNGVSKTVDSLGSINADTYGEQGLIGIALDPNFKTNRYIYVNYSFIEAGNSWSYRISRFTLGAGTGGKIGSEKILLKIPRQENSWHTGGDMSFDAYGDLWCAIGDNQQTEMTAGNTGDLRGGILRIHPDTSTRGYSIPKGNFGEVFSAYFKAQGNAAVATQYADTSMVKPEIYVKGTRNAYTLSLDPVRRWMTWAEVGPDQGKVSEEYNMVKASVYGGWPYFSGQENMGAGSPSGGPATGPYGTAVPFQPNPNALVNNLAGIKGVKNLPPNHNPIFAKQESCNMGGPIFLYDGSNPLSTQFPPQLDHKWIVGDCNGPGYGYRLLTFDALGDTVTGPPVQIWTGSNVPPTNELVDMKQGPDGSLYVVDWGNSSIFRVDYTGTCKDPTLLREKTGCTDPTKGNYDPTVPAAFSDPRLCGPTVSVLGSGRTFAGNPILVNGQAITISLLGGYEIKVLDVSGRVTFAMSGEGKKTYTLPAFKQSGVYQLQVKSAEGVFTHKLLSMTP